MQAYQHKLPNHSPLGAAPITRLGATEENLVTATAVEAPVNVGYLVGGIVGAAIVGAGIGYVASGRQQGAITGAVAGAGVSATTNSLAELFFGSKLRGAVYGLAAAGAFAFAWYRKPN